MAVNHRPSVDPHRVGDTGERRTAQLLVERGWVLVHSNFRDGPREIDLVVRRQGVVAFVEVKSRRTARHDALESIGWKKRRNLARAARAWIGEFGRRGDTYRFDVAVVIGQPGTPPTIEFLEDAWRIGE